MRGPTELVAWCEFLISKLKHQPTPFCANHFWRWRFTCFKTFSCMQSAKRDLYTDDRDLTGQLLRHVEKCSGYIFLFLFIYALIWMFLHSWAAHNKFQAMIFTIDNNRDTFNSLENGNIIHFAWLQKCFSYTWRSKIMKWWAYFCTVRIETIMLKPVIRE
jgi:hypothetical protein